MTVNGQILGLVASHKGKVFVLSRPIADNCGFMALGGMVKFFYFSTKRQTNTLSIDILITGVSNVNTKMYHLSYITKMIKLAYATFQQPITVAHSSGDNV